jgi:Spermine/spermidine synthase domain
MASHRPARDLFFVSALVLFLELVCIRWFPAHVMFLSFFTNTMLLASFIGMSIGCLMARRPTNHIQYTPYLLLLAISAGLLLEVNQGKLAEMTQVGERGKSEVVFFGAEAGVSGELKFRVPVEVVAGLFYLLVGAVLVGPGQEMGRAFNRMTSRTHSYAANLLGSLAGITAFALCSHFQLPPIVWLTITGIGIGYFLLKNSTVESPVKPLVPFTALALVLVMSIPTSFNSFLPMQNPRETIWSPYYRIDYIPDIRFISTNLTGHQMMIERGLPTQAPYDLPYLFQREVKTWPEYKRILVIGAGSGNDLSRALYWCGPDTVIDAVEIDPVIQQLGMKYHPNKPYDDPRIIRHLNDGRNFLRSAKDGTYDLVVFALVDSLVLHSGYSSIRLESFLFSSESFADVKRVLKPTGTTAVYNYFRQGWIMARLKEVLNKHFGSEPVVLIDPPYTQGAELPLENNYPLSSCGVFIGGSEETIAPLRKLFSDGSSFWVPGRAGMDKELPGRFATTMPDVKYDKNLQVAENADGNRPAWVALNSTKLEDSKGTLKPADDNWPFLYVRQPGIPSLTWRGVGLMLGLSLVLWAIYHFGTKREAASTTPSTPETGLYLRAFFLGAGFMLIETKAVVQMALLFGSTWNVNTYVFAAVLLMAVMGNAFTGVVKPKRLEPYYIGLFLAIGVGLLVPLETFLGMNEVLKIVCACALVFAPIIFAGVVFPTTFSRVQQPDRFFAANVAGALVGGLVENASMLLGFQHLLLVAAGFYLLSACFGNRK